MKKLIVLLTVSTVLAIPALAVAPEFEKMEYEGNGFIEADFRGDVSYETPSVILRDAAGAEIAAAIFERDDDDLTFRAEGLVPGATYEVVISGVRSGRDGEFGAVTGQISIPEAGIPAVGSIEYDADDRELEIDFVENVDYSNPALEITDADGKIHEARILETDNDSVEARVDGLVPGETYLAKISGVSLRGLNDYRTAASEFIAADD